MTNNPVLKQLTLLFKYILICGIILIVFAELLLRFVDPLGVYHYFDGQFRQQHIMTLAAHGYNLASGTHDFGNFTVTIGANGNRIVPDSNRTSDCTIAAIGDSLTFGWGVADRDTFVNQLAQDFPAVHWLNVARSGYSAPNIALLQDAYPADGYLWLMVNNDHYPQWDYTITVPNRLPFAIELYWQYRFNQPDSVIPDWDSYWAALARIAARPTLFFGFEGESPALETSDRYTVNFIPAYTATVSAYDRHPNAAGHHQIATAMTSAERTIQAFIDRVCNV